MVKSITGTEMTSSIKTKPDHPHVTEDPIVELPPHFHDPKEMADIFNGVNKAVLFADSFGTIRHFRSNRLLRLMHNYQDALDIRPHRVTHGNVFIHDLEWINLSEGGMSLLDLSTKEWVLHDWARGLPLITIIHAGAIDVNNRLFPVPAENGNIAKAYCDHFFRRLTAIEEMATRNLSQVQRSEYDSRKQHHKYLIIGLPDWGQNWEPRFPHSMTPAEYTLARKSINDRMGNYQRKLWREFKGVLFTPKTSMPNRHRMHLADPDNSRYTNQILRVASRMICSNCRRSLTVGRFIKAEHHHDALLRQGDCVGH